MPKGRFAEDLSGRRYGKLTVLKREPSRVRANGRTEAMFLCKCDCGIEKVIPATRLRTGGVTSCGCERKSIARIGQLDDLTGQTFGRWLVLNQAPSEIEPSGRKATMWHCRCKCGTERNIRAGTLKSGMSKSCGCLKRYDRDFVGERFGRWLVIEADAPHVVPGGRSFSTWKCRCDCGTEMTVLESALVSGKSASCGCARVDSLRMSQYHDFTGQRFGELTVVRRLPDKHTDAGNRIQLWLCRCSCGKEIVRARSNLALGCCTSCGHDKVISSLECHVRDYLDAHDWVYDQQVRYSGLVGKRNQPLSYDFLVYDKDCESYCLIEC